MIKKTVFAVLGLAFVLALASPPKARCWRRGRSGCRPGLCAASGLWLCGGPSRGIMHIRMATRQLYARPPYVYPPYGYYGHVYRGGHWGRPVARVYRGYGWRGGYRR